MSITLKTGATNSTNGGTAVVYSELTRANNRKTFAQEGAEYLARKTLDVQVNNAVKNSGAPGGYGHNRALVTLRVPVTLANGERDTDSIQISLSTNIERTKAQMEAYVDELLVGLMPSGTIRTAITTFTYPS